jgi:anti-anti-sigma factor
MQRHQTTSTIGIGTQLEGAQAGTLANRAETALDPSTRTRPVRHKPRLVSRSVSVWTHTLLLTGELTYRSARSLEMEIEHLCEAGVTGITLDLRQLTYIDSIGVAVISFRCGLCRRQGCDFALIGGSRSIQRAFERAGATDLLPVGVDELTARRLRTSGPGQRSAMTLRGDS